MVKVAGRVRNKEKKSAREFYRFRLLLEYFDEDRQLGVIRNSNLHTKSNLHYGEVIKEKERTIKSLIPSIMKDSYYDVKFEINFIY